MYEPKVIGGGTVVGKLEVEERIEALEKKVAELETGPGQPDAPNFKVINKGHLIA